MQRKVQIWLATKKRVLYFRTSGIKGEICMELVMTMYRKRSGKNGKNETNQLEPILRYKKAEDFLHDEVKFGEPRKE